jgi:hypothetical protein
MLSSDKLFIGLEQIAQLTGLPESFLRREAQAGRIPHLKIPGKALLFNQKLTEEALLRLMMPGTQQDNGATPPPA